MESLSIYSPSEQGIKLFVLCALLLFSLRFYFSPEVYCVVALKKENESIENRCVKTQRFSIFCIKHSTKSF